MPSVYDFVTWEPLLRVLRAANPVPDSYLAGPGYLAGQLEPGGWSLPLPSEFPPPGQDRLRGELNNAVQKILGALTEDGLDDISFVAEPAPAPGGRTVLHLLTSGPSVDGGTGPYPGALILVEGAIPEPWRRLPEPMPGAVPARTANPGMLERTLRERLPEVIGATDAELSGAEARLGIALPEELAALYRAIRPRWQEWDDTTARRVSDALGVELLSLEGLTIADPASRECDWQFAASEAVVTPPDAAVQGLVGSPGWITFAHDDFGDLYAVDLTPGPRGHVGQVIMLSHEHNIGATLIAESLTDLIVHRRRSEDPSQPEDQLPVVAYVNRRGLPSVAAAAHPELEVLSIGVRSGEPLSLAAVAGSPRLRTLTVNNPGTLADPREIAELTGLEFLELPPEDWRVLLDAEAVPKGLSAARIVHFGWHPLQIAALANEILGRWGRPPIIQTTVEA